MRSDGNIANENKGSIETIRRKDLVVRIESGEEKVTSAGTGIDTRMKRIAVEVVVDRIEGGEEAESTEKTNSKSLGVERKLCTILVIV